MPQHRKPLAVWQNKTKKLIALNSIIAAASGSTRNTDGMAVHVFKQVAPQIAPSWVWNHVPEDTEFDTGYRKQCQTSAIPVAVMNEGRKLGYKPVQFKTMGFGGECWCCNSGYSCDEVWWYFHIICWRGTPARNTTNAWIGKMYRAYTQQPHY